MGFDISITVFGWTSFRCVWTPNCQSTEPHAPSFLVTCSIPFLGKKKWEVGTRVGVCMIATHRQRARFVQHNEIVVNIDYIDGVIQNGRLVPVLFFMVYFVKTLILECTPVHKRYIVQIQDSVPKFVTRGSFVWKKSDFRFPPTVPARFVFGFRAHHNTSTGYRHHITIIINIRGHQSVRQQHSTLHNHFVWIAKIRYCREPSILIDR